MAKSPPFGQQPRSLVGKRLGDAFGRGLVQEVVACVRLGVRIPRRHRDAVRACLAQHRGDAALVLHRDHDGIHAARDPVLDQFILLRRVQARRPIPDQVHAEFLRCLFRTGARADEVWVALGLGHHGDGESSGAAVMRDVQADHDSQHHGRKQAERQKGPGLPCASFTRLDRAPGCAGDPH